MKNSIHLFNKLVPVSEKIAYYADLEEEVN